jgi:plasmid maintenance system killer protein
MGSNTNRRVIDLRMNGIQKKRKKKEKEHSIELNGQIWSQCFTFSE